MTNKTLHLSSKFLTQIRQIHPSRHANPAPQTNLKKSLKWHRSTFRFQTRQQSNLPKSKYLHWTSNQSHQVNCRAKMKRWRKKRRRTRQTVLTQVSSKTMSMGPNIYLRSKSLNNSVHRKLDWAPNMSKKKRLPSSKKASLRKIIQLSRWRTAQSLTMFQ